MSGQPNRYNTSAEKFRNEYMDALNMRANVDDFNLQANKNYKATKTLPPTVLQMIDNRTTTEILADTEKLKLSIIAELKPVMNSGTASVVVQKIQTAPVNADGSFLIWTAQNMPEVVKNLKKKYKFGIKGDMGDAENIVLFLSDMFSKIKDYSGSVNSYFTSSGESKTGIREGDLDALKSEYDKIVARLISKVPNIANPTLDSVNGSMIQTIKDIKNKFDDLIDILTSDAYNNIIKKNIDLNTLDYRNINGINDLSKQYFKLIDNLPSPSELRALYRQLEKSMDNNNIELSNKILYNIYELFPSDEEVDEVYNATEQTVAEYMAERLRINREQKRESIASKVDRTTNPTGFESTPLGPTRAPLPKPKPRGIKSSRSDLVVAGDAEETKEEVKSDTVREQISNLTLEIDDRQKAVNGLSESIKAEEADRKKRAPFTWKKDERRAELQQQESFLKSMQDERKRLLSREGLGTSLDRPPDRSTGVGLKRRRGRPKGSGIGPKPFSDKIDESKGITPVKKYYPFGKYFVNSHKLNHGNVLSIKSKSGTNIREYPSKSVSPHLGSVIKTIIGGGVPSWNDMDKLSPDEKDYLYKISKRAEFADKISIPTPSKDQQEKDIHEFDVCKGEIMAGNDSKELIKKFKLLIIKLSKNGTIPKREASEVMTELLELGY